MSDPKTAVKPDFSRAEITEPASPYDFEKLAEVSFDIRKPTGELVATITCHEAAGKESAALSIISAVENLSADAFCEARGGKIEKLPKGGEIWRFPSDKPLSREEANFLTFRRRIYPKLAACSTSSIGRLPTAQEIFFNLRESVMEQWYSAAKQVNPAWFDEFRSAEKKTSLLRSQMETAPRNTKRKSHSRRK